MRRLGANVCLILGLATMTGCAMCASPYDDDYPAFGGRVERLDRSRGRVGSIFSLPGEPHAAATGGLVEGEVIEGEIIEGEFMEGATIEAPYDLDWTLDGEVSEPAPLDGPVEANPIQPIEPKLDDTVNEQAAALLDLTPPEPAREPSQDEAGPYDADFFELSLIAPQ